MSEPIRWIACDTGLLHFGWAIGTRAQDGTVEVLSGGVFLQPKATKKRNVKQMEDDFDRAAKLTAKLAEVMDSHKPHVLCVESLSLPRNSSTAAKLGRAMGVVSALSMLAKVAVVSISPQEVKEACLGKRGGSKSEVRGFLTKRYGSEVIKRITTGVTLRMHEHPIDSLAVLHASLDSQVFRMVVGP